MPEPVDPALDPGVDGALFDYLQDVDDYVAQLRAEANRALTRAVRQASTFGWSQRRIAAAVGRSQPEVARLLRANPPVLVDYAVGDPHGIDPADEGTRARQQADEDVPEATAAEGPPGADTAPAALVAPAVEAAATAGPDGAAIAAPARVRRRPSSTLTWVLRDKREQIVRIAEAHGASNVRVFGSVARGEDDNDSDIDLLFDYGPTMGLFEVSGLKLQLEEELGRPVDVANARSLWPRIARKALAEAVPL